MNRHHRTGVAVIFVLVALAGCTSSVPPEPPASQAPVDYPALEAQVEQTIASGPTPLDQVRAVVISVDGQTRIAHYRHGFAPDDHLHVFSVTKSVLSILVGIAVDDGLISGVDAPLSELLPQHRRAMTDATAAVTLRQLMAMTAGFRQEGAYAWEQAVKTGQPYIEILLERRSELEPGVSYSYTNTSAEVVAAVLAAALARSSGDSPPSILDYARTKLFDPLGISTRPAFTDPLPNVYSRDFSAAGFGWGTDPDGIQTGGMGLRLTAPDVIKLGELYRLGGTWQGRTIVSPSWIDLTTAHPADARGDAYGLLWYTSIVPSPNYYASGYGGQRLYVVPRDGLVITYLTAVAPGTEVVDDADLAPITALLASALTS